MVAYPGRMISFFFVFISEEGGDGQPILAESELGR